MHGFGSHTYSLISAQGERHWVKWHYKTKQGIKNLAPAEAARLAGTDPDYAQRDLFNAIERGDFPKWSVCIQIMSEAQAATHYENPFDVTKTWSDLKSTRLNSSHSCASRMPSSACNNKTKIQYFHQPL